MMKKFYLLIFALLSISSLVIVGCDREEVAEEGFYSEEAPNFKSEKIEGQYIVVLNSVGPRAAVIPGTYQDRLNAVKATAVSLLKRSNVENYEILHSYAASIIGFSVKGISVDQAEMLARDSQVSFVEQDQTMHIFGGPPGGGGSTACASNSTEVTPCGISAVNGGANYTGSRKAYVLDSGIDLDHPDLNVANFGFNGTNENGLDDGNGHGSHVAGTIGAKGGNGIGVVGVAAGALVVPVKVLNKRGSGTNSGVIAGVDYVGGNGAAGDVANMSLGGGASSALDNAVVAASAGGVWFVVAAGNDGANANNYSPARANGPYVRTIASMTCSGGWSSFSNFANPPVDWIAPGSAICSTYKSGGYASLSGTSMAAPHAAGVILVKGGTPASCGTVSHSSGSYPRICI